MRNETGIVPSFPYLLYYVAISALAIIIPPPRAFAAPPAPRRYVLTIARTPTRRVRPDEAVGMGIDGSDHGTTDRLLHPDTLRALRSLRLPNLTYRLRTELAIETWHWNPEGVWSDPAHERGYFVSGVAGGGAIRRSWGYRLPRRGSTGDQANNDGYSRLADNDRATFWKSNPYLDPYFTGDPATAHPQWIVVDLGRILPVNAVRVEWAVPYATRWRVEYCITAPGDEGGEFSATFNAGAKWHPFPGGAVTNGSGGIQTVRLGKTPRATRFVRITLAGGSRTAPSGGTGDIRDALGYAAREIGVGVIGASGAFADHVRHVPDGKEQTIIHVSSSDPWHRATDRDIDTEQPGLDPLFAAKLSSRPIMLPVGIVYDTPENAANLLRYARRHRFPVTQIELGEEPDGQYLSPEDYGALYVRFARALRRVDPAIKLGGPSLQTATDGWIHWPDAAGDTSWMRRFLAYLRQHRASDTFNFFSLEWYPFDILTPSSESLLRSHPALLDDSLTRLAREGVPTDIPWVISELGWSPFSSQSEVELPGTLLDAEIVARFLTKQNGTAYFYGVQPGALEFEEGATAGVSWGGLFAFLADDTGRVTATLPTAWTARMLMDGWFQVGAGDQWHTLYEATARRARTGKDNDAVGTYALRQPGGRWSVLLLNRDARNACRVTLPTRNPVSVQQYGPAQYKWHPNGAGGRPAYSRPPRRFVEVTRTLTLPPMSLTVATWVP